MVTPFFALMSYMERSTRRGTGRIAEFKEHLETLRVPAQDGNVWLLVVSLSASNLIKRTFRYTSRYRIHDYSSAAFQNLMTTLINCTRETLYEK